MDKKHRVIFVCTGNTCRSPMAAHLFNHLAARTAWAASSCGLAAFEGEPASQPAISTLRTDYGLDLSGHRSRRVSEDCLSGADWILGMTFQHAEMLKRIVPDLADRILTVGEMAGQPDVSIPDPYGGSLEIYQKTAAVLAGLIEKIVRRLENLA